METKRFGASRTIQADLIKQRWSSSAARRVLAAWRESGMSLSGFGRAYGVNAQRLSWWRKRLDAEVGERAVAPLAFIPAALSGVAPAVVVRLPGGVVLEASEAGTMPASWVATLARELARPA